MHAVDNLPPLREVISRHGLNAKKSFGQHFLLDLNLCRRIARAAGPTDEATFYEVGPGPGGLTRALLSEGARKVIAVEFDPRCVPALKEIEDAFPGRLNVVEADALSLDEHEIFGRDVGAVRIAANLPYNVGTALLIKWLSAQAWPPFWSSLTLMFQREVADRLVAAPGTKAYGRLSVLAQWRCSVRILFNVARSAFVPPPQVTSAVVRIEPREAPVSPAALSDLEAITAATFGQRRKMLRQSLKRLSVDTERLIELAGVDPTARPEQLTVEELAALARAFAKVRPPAKRKH